MRYFLDVARTEHMTRSAERLNLAQPALSRSMHRLESELGCRLFEPCGRGIRLTESGRALQRRLGAVVTQLDLLEDDLAAIRGERTGGVRVRMMAASILTVEAISGWMDLHPEVRVAITQDEGGDVRADVSVESVFPAPARRGAPRTAVFRERILVAVPVAAGYGPGPLDLADLRDASFISLAGSKGFRRTCDSLCAAFGFRPAVSLESDSPAVVRKMIGMGLGVGFWPEYSWGDVSHDGATLLPLALPEFERCIAIRLLRPDVEDADAEGACAARRPASCGAAVGLFDHLCSFFHERMGGDVRMGGEGGMGGEGRTDGTFGPGCDLSDGGTGDAPGAPGAGTCASSCEEKL